MGDEVHRLQAPGGAGLIHVEAEPQPVHRAGSLQWAGLAAVAVAAIVADQVTKRAIDHRLALNEAHRVLPFLTITHVRNSGIAFGIFPGRLAAVSLLTAAAVVWMLVHFARSGAGQVRKTTEGDGTGTSCDRSETGESCFLPRR